MQYLFIIDLVKIIFLVRLKKLVNWGFKSIFKFKRFKCISKFDNRLGYFFIFNVIGILVKLWGVLVRVLVIKSISRVVKNCIFWIWILLVCLSVMKLVLKILYSFSRFAQDINIFFIIFFSGWFWFLFSSHNFNSILGAIEVILFV